MALGIMGWLQTWAIVFFHSSPKLATQVAAQAHHPNLLKKWTLWELLT
jgi:hypothetical protein